jgi:hypothetical protein
VCGVCVSQVGYTTTSAGDGVGGVKAVAHAIEREGEGEGNGWGGRQRRCYFIPVSPYIERRGVEGDGS